MKKAKKVLALLVVLATMLSTLALPAAAATADDNVEPCAAVAFCPRCATALNDHWTSTSTKTESVGAGECEYKNTAHSHTVTYYYENFDCPTCGVFKYSTAYATYCKYMLAS